LLTTGQQALAGFLLSGEIHRFSTDTYQREIERYGAITIEETERIFWRDSKLVCQLLTQDLDEASLLMIAVKVVDGYQTACNLGAKAKQQLCARVFTELFNQQGGSSALRQELARKYRMHQSWMLHLLQRTYELVVYHHLYRAHQSLKAQADRSANCFEKIK
jgi:thiopeptide-type bacteriocin biosynthesis protein